MRLVSLRVRNYRTIGSDEQTLKLDGGLSLVGPNNSGKTNLLRAAELLFTGWDNAHGYERDVDLTFGEKRVKTTLLATFEGDDSPGSVDRPIYDALDSLHSILGSRRHSQAFTLSLQFTASNTPVYQFFPNAKQPAAAALRTQYSRTQRQLVTDLIAKFACHYVPSARSMKELYEELIVPFLRASAAEAMAPHGEAITEVLATVAGSFNEELSRAGLGSLTVSFALPNNSLEQLLRGFDFLIADPEQTAIFRKGQGVQSTALLAGFLWITRKEEARGKSVVWLLEEPESYLHPELSRSTLTLLARLRQHSLVVVTTHALAFVPQNPQLVAGTVLHEARTRVDSYSTYTEATERLRSALGVQFSDYYNLSRFNLLVEGPSDRMFIDWILDRIPEDVKPWKSLRAAQILDFGGVRHLSGFLRATYGMISAERASVAVFDGDAAGEKERRDLQQYFGQKKIGFTANENFVSVRNRFAIEGLFPDEWIKRIYADRPTWFTEYSVDASGELEPYRIRDNVKSNVGAQLINWADEAEDFEWAARWLKFGDVADAALERLDSNIERRSRVPQGAWGELSGDGQASRPRHDGQDG